MDNRRETIVINKRFQYQTSLLIASVTVLLVNAYLIARMVLPGQAPLDLSVNYAIGIGLVQLLLVLGIWYGSLKATHRIAGPVYVFKRELLRLGQGDLTARIDLRDTDMFQEEALAINGSIDALRERVQRLKLRANQLQEAQSTGGDISNALGQLQADLAELLTSDGD